ncbi:hypothetical protein ABK040_011950 [Willaertia magna]
MSISSHSFKLVFVGNDSIGKTCLLITFVNNVFPETYIPTVFDNYNANMIVDDECISLGLWDTTGSDMYDRLRPLSYPNTDLFILVFAVDDLGSFNDVKTKWIPEVKCYCENAKIVILGTKSDSANRQVKKEDGMELIKESNALAYLECSAKSIDSVQDVFQTFGRLCLQHCKDREYENSQPSWSDNDTEIKFGIELISVTNNSSPNTNDLARKTSNLSNMSIVNHYNSHNNFNLCKRVLKHTMFSNLNQLKQEIINLFSDLSIFHNNNKKEEDNENNEDEEEEQEEGECSVEMRIFYFDKELEDYYELEKLEQLSDDQGNIPSTIKLKVFY